MRRSGHRYAHRDQRGRARGEKAVCEPRREASGATSPRPRLDGRRPASRTEGVHVHPVCGALLRQPEQATPGPRSYLLGLNVCPGGHNASSAHLRTRGVRLGPCASSGCPPQGSGGLYFSALHTHETPRGTPPCPPAASSRTVLLGDCSFESVGWGWDFFRASRMIHSYPFHMQFKYFSSHIKKVRIGVLGGSVG